MDEKGDLFTDFHGILARRRIHFCRLFNVYGVIDVRQTEIHTSETLLAERSAFEFKMAIENLKRHKSPVIDQIPAELIKPGGRTIRSEIHKLINSICNNKELPEEWNESISVPIYKKGDKTDCSNSRGISLLLTTCKILSDVVLSKLTAYAEEITGDHRRGFRRITSATDNIFCIRQLLEKKWE